MVVGAHRPAVVALEPRTDLADLDPLAAVALGAPLPGAGHVRDQVEDDLGGSVDADTPRCVGGEAHGWKLGSRSGPRTAKEPPAKPAAPPRSVDRTGQMTRTFWASSPFRPGATSNWTALALVEALVALADDVGEVDEHVVALLTRDEAEALLGVESLPYCSQEIALLI